MSLFELHDCERCHHLDHLDQRCPMPNCTCASSRVAATPSTFDRPGEVRAREQAIEAVGHHADSTWADEAYRALVRVAGRQATLISDDVWVEVEAIAPDATTPEGRAMGAIIRRGVKQGIIEASGNYRPSARKNCHGNLVAEWTSLVVGR